MDSAPYHFTSSIAYDVNTPINWYWNFVDGQQTNINTANAVSHAYSNAATNITIRINAVCNREDVKSDTVDKSGTVIYNKSQCGGFQCK
ncbi:MAG: hypothetical protein IPL97_04785 [Niastella sp.]|nr:hypothetical protein [Niastella sp.]